MNRKVTPPGKSPYTAMTVNERLIVAGLLEQFDSAAFAHDEEKIRDILAKVDLDDETADAIFRWIKESPHSMYRNQK